MQFIMPRKTETKCRLIKRTNQQFHTSTNEILTRCNNPQQENNKLRNTTKHQNNKPKNEPRATCLYRLIRKYR